MSSGDDDKSGKSGKSDSEKSTQGTLTMLLSAERSARGTIRSITEPIKGPLTDSAVSFHMENVHPKMQANLGWTVSSTQASSSQSAQSSDTAESKGSKAEAERKRQEELLTKFGDDNWVNDK